MQVVLTLPVADQAYVVLRKRKPEVGHKVACPDCGEQVSVRILRYSHGPTCVIKKQNPKPTDKNKKDRRGSLLGDRGYNGAKVPKSNAK